MTPITVIIDGNNLAYYLFNISQGDRVSTEDDSTLSWMLYRWLKHYRDQVCVDLCLDRRDPSIDRYPGITIWGAEYPLKADDIIEGLVDEQISSEIPCYVITRDIDLAHAIEAKGVSVIQPAKFILDDGTYPPFFEKPIQVRKIPQKPESKQWGPSVQFQPRYQQKTEKHQDTREYDAIVTRMLDERVKERIDINRKDKILSLPVVEVYEQNRESSTETPLKHTRTAYQLSFELWPAEEGAKFLLGSFCSDHKKEIRGLVDKSEFNNFRPRELRAIANMLLELCGNEVDFVNQGCLMDRARLTMLKAGDTLLTIDEIATAINRPLSDLRKKMKNAEGKWVEKLSVEENHA